MALSLRPEYFGNVSSICPRSTSALRSEVVYLVTLALAGVILLT